MKSLIFILSLLFVFSSYASGSNYVYVKQAGSLKCTAYVSKESGITLFARCHLFYINNESTFYEVKRAVEKRAKVTVVDSGSGSGVKQVSMVLGNLTCNEWISLESGMTNYYTCDLSEDSDGEKASNLFDGMDVEAKRLRSLE